MVSTVFGHAISNYHQNHHSPFGRYWIIRLTPIIYLFSRCSWSRMAEGLQRLHREPRVHVALDWSLYSFTILSFFKVLPFKSPSPAKKGTRRVDAFSFFICACFCIYFSGSFLFFIVGKQYIFRIMGFSGNVLRTKLCTWSVEE